MAAIGASSSVVLFAVAVIFIARVNSISPFVDFAKDDNSTVNPPTILLRGSDFNFEEFLVQDPSQLNLLNVDPTIWDNITILVRLRSIDPTGRKIIAESIVFNSEQAFLANRISTRDLKSTVDFRDGSSSNQERDYTVLRQQPANLSEILLSLKYDYVVNTLDPIPPPEFRDIYITINFEQGCGSQDIHIVVHYVGENSNAPQVNITDQEAVFTEGMLYPISVTNGSLTVVDGDNSFFPIKSANVSITDNPGSEDTSNEQLTSTVTFPHISVMYSGGVLTLTGDGTPEEYSQVLNGVTYFNSDNDLGGKPFDSRKLVFTVSDGSFSTSNFVIVHLVNVNDPPVIRVDGNRTTSLKYTEGNGPTGIEANLTAEDLDNTHLNGTMIILCGAVDGDEITFGVDLPAGVSRGDTTTVSFCLDNRGNNLAGSGSADESCIMPWDSICSSYGNATFFELQGLATVEEYGELLQSIEYHNSRSPALFEQHNKTIVITAWDGHYFSSPIYICITFYPVNDGPILQFNATANPFVFAPLANRIHFLGFTEEDRPVLVFPRTTTLFDVDSEFAYMAKIVLTGIVLNETLIWNQTLADELELNVTYIKDSSMWIVKKNGLGWSGNTQTGKATFYELKKLLLTFQYENNDHTEPVEGVRTVTAVIQDAEGALSQEVFIYINVTTRNDKPNLDLGKGKNIPENTTFEEIAQGSTDVGIHITTRPHRIMISDEIEEQHYTTKVVIRLRADSCGELDQNQEFVYLLGIIPSGITIHQAVNGQEVNFTTDTEPTDSGEIEALTEAYEQLLFDMRYIHAGDEATVFCPLDPDRLLYRFIDITIFDSGDPTKSRTVSTRIQIIPVNDQAPKLIVHVSGDCLVPDNDLPSVDLFGDFVSDPSSRKKKKRDIKTIGQKKTVESPQVLSVHVSGGWEKEFGAGSQMVVKFSVDTNTPVVLRPSDLRRVVSMSPAWLHDLPHIGVWKDPKTLHVVFPVVMDTMNGKVTADELVVAFLSLPDCIDLEENPSCACICDSTGQSCGITGSYGVYGQIDVVTQKPKDPEKSVAQKPKDPEKSVAVMDADDVEQTQLHDWLLITVGIALLGIAVIVVLTVSYKRRKATAGKPKPLLG